MNGLDVCQGGGNAVPKPKNITAHEVQTRLELGEQMQIVDVREDQEVAEGMIPGALHIRLAEVGERLAEISPDKELIVVCRSGRRSRAVCNFLYIHGYTKATNMIDGMLAWRGHTENHYA